MKSSLSPCVLRLLERDSNPSPPLPNDPYLLENLAYWPQDTEREMFLSRGVNMRDLFINIREKWPDALLEALHVGKETIQILDTMDPRILEQGGYNRVFVTVTKLY